MSRPRIVFCYRYGLLGGVSAQLLNRLPYLSRSFDVRIIYERDYGMVSQFPTGVATVAATADDRAAALRRAWPDITVVIDSPSFFEAWRAAGLLGQLVLEVHTTTANRMYLNDKEQLRGISHIITVSKYMERLLHTFGLADLAPVSVVPNCLEARWREPAAPAPSLDTAPLIWVGKLDGHKRWRTALDIIEKVRTESDRASTPVLVGGFTAPAIELQALTTRLSNSATLAGAVWWPRVEYGMMPQLYSATGGNGGVHLCTSMNESFGMAVAESVIRGCPVVAPAVGALPELLPAAALYEDGDWATASDKVCRALADKSFRDELLTTAGSVSELTEPERVGDAYQRIMNDLLDSGHSDNQLAERR